MKFLGLNEQDSPVEGEMTGFARLTAPANAEPKVIVMLEPPGTLVSVETDFGLAVMLKLYTLTIRVTGAPSVLVLPEESPDAALAA